MCPCLGLKLPEHVRCWTKVVHRPSSAGQEAFWFGFFFQPLCQYLCPIQCLPMHLLRVYDAFVLLQSRKRKMAFTALHACQGCWCCALFSELCCWILLRLNDWKAGTYAWGITEICDRSPTLSDCSFLLSSAARNTHKCFKKEMVHYNKDQTLGLV